MDNLTGYELIKTSSWIGDAACKGLDPELFFAERGHSASEPQTVCVACPVRQQCAEYARTINQTKGVWGGQTERARRAAKRTNPPGETPKKVLPKHGTTTSYHRGCRCPRCVETHMAHQYDYRDRSGR